MNTQSAPLRLGVGRPAHAWRFRNAGQAILATQAPLKKARGAAVSGGMIPLEYGEGARIVMISAGSQPRVLTGTFSSAADPEVSFDGKRMLFAAKPSPSSNWDIFEMDLASGATHQVTRNMGDCRTPVYLGTLFTLDSEAPWYELAFTAPADPKQPASSPRNLYSCTLDGQRVHPLTFSPGGDRNPVMLADGRLLFSSWLRASAEHGSSGRVPLMSSQTDGTSYLLMTGDEGRRVKQMACVTPQRLIVFIESDRPAADGAGSVGSVSLRRNLHSYRAITQPAQGLFYSPSALPDGSVLVSRREADASSHYAVFQLDPDRGELTPVFDEPRYQNIQAKVVAPREQPDGRSTSVDPADPVGQFYALDLYDSQLKGWVKPGTPLRLRVAEVLNSPALREEGPRAGGGAAPKRVLGELPVEDDGSFNIKLPANLPVQLQMIDSDGIALAASEFVWTRNHKAEGCVGCHSDPEVSPDNHFAKALAKAPVVLTEPPEGKGKIDFRHDVMPIVAGKCAACHRAAPSSSGLHLNATDAARAYEALVGTVSGGTQRAYVLPGSARTSPLVWHLFGRNTSRAWDPASAQNGVAKRIPAGGAQLTAEEKRTIVEWIDLGAAFDSAAQAAKSTQPAPKPANAAGGAK